MCLAWIEGDLDAALGRRHYVQLARRDSEEVWPVSDLHGHRECDIARVVKLNRMLAYTAVDRFQMKNLC